MLLLLGALIPGTRSRSQFDSLSQWQGVDPAPSQDQIW